jgi:hypothetical protein
MIYRRGAEAQRKNRINVTARPLIEEKIATEDTGDTE